MLAALQSAKRIRQRNIYLAQGSLSGFTLLEVLLTIVVLAFGILGLSTLQNKVQTGQLESYQRAQAILLLEDMVGRINANRSQAASYVTGTSNPLGVGDSQPSNCTGMTVGVARDQCEWSNALKGASEQIVSTSTNLGSMIGARGCVELVQAENSTSGVCLPGIYRVSVTWQGLTKTAAPALVCGSGLYGETGLQRTISSQVTVALLSCL